jgi:hypothetical protein
MKNSRRDMNLLDLLSAKLRAADAHRYYLLEGKRFLSESEEMQFESGHDGSAASLSIQGCVLFYRGSESFGDRF